MLFGHGFGAPISYILAFSFPFILSNHYFPALFTVDLVFMTVCEATETQRRTWSHTASTPIPVLSNLTVRTVPIFPFILLGLHPACTVACWHHEV